MKASDEKVWQPTAVQNLVRYAPSGTYFARFRVGGKLVWKSLKTATFFVAKERLPDTLRDHRSKIESLTAFAEGKADCVADCIGTSADFKPVLAQTLEQLPFAASCTIIEESRRRSGQRLLRRADSSIRYTAAFLPLTINASAGKLIVPPIKYLRAASATACFIVGS